MRCLPCSQEVDFLSVDPDWVYLSMEPREAVSQRLSVVYGEEPMDYVKERV